MLPMVLVARSGRARERILAVLAALGVVCDVAATPGELCEVARGKQYCGVLFDVPTLLREKGFDKHLLRDLALIYPSVKLKYDPDADVVYALGDGAVALGRDGLSVFVEACRQVAPRPLRRGGRISVHLPVVLRRADATDREDERAITSNISFWGCFVVTPSDFTPGEAVVMEFPDLRGCRVRTRVAWMEPWGLRRELPGVGLSFEEVPAVLAAELERFGCDPQERKVASQGKGL